MKRKSFFSLLEVLIAILLVTFSIPLLIAPFLYTVRNYEADIKDAYLEKAAIFALAGFLEDLQRGQKVLSDGEVNPAKEEWFSKISPFIPGFTVTYILQRLKPSANSDEEETQNIELWQVVFTFQNPPSKNLSATQFSFKFVALKEKAV